MSLDKLMDVVGIFVLAVFTLPFVLIAISFLGKLVFG